MDKKRLFLPLALICLLAALTVPMIACSGPEEETETETGTTETEVETEDGKVEEVDTESDRVDADVDLDDAGITAKVKTKFAADETVSALNINVDTKDSVVTLSGHVKDEAAKQKAEQLARETEGVTNVVNNLMIGEGEHEEGHEGN